jgi:periplasmic protein TonB
MAIIEKVTPPPEPPKTTPPVPEPVLAVPRPRVRFVDRKPPMKTEAPPPPNETLPPKPEATPPVFGVTLDSVVTGDSAVAVPVGNTVMTKERKPNDGRPASYAPPPVPGHSDVFSPVSDAYVAEYPRVLKEIEPEYPIEAQRLKLPGEVVLKVGIDRSGKVRSVKVTKRAGNGFDEAATKAMWQFRFGPCRLKTGDSVDCVINYKHTFKPN